MEEEADQWQVSEAEDYSSFIFWEQSADMDKNN